MSRNGLILSFPVLIHLILKTTGKNKDLAAVQRSPAQLPPLASKHLPVNNNPLNVHISCYFCPSLFLCAPTPVCVCVCVSYLEEGAVALQPGGAERGDGAQAAPEVDA